MFYSFKNCEVKINDFVIYVNNAAISTVATIAPNYNVGKTYPEYYGAQNGIAGSLKFSYYLTGKDFIKDFINNDSQFIRGYFGGLSFNNGCLTNYSVNAEANSPIIVDSEIVFFDDLQGIFIPSYKNAPNVNPLNFSDATISSTIDNLSAITNFAYNLSVNIDGSYNDDSTNKTKPTIDNINFGEQQITLNVTSDNLTGILTPSGASAYVAITLKDNLGVPQENLNVSGKIVSKNISFNVNSIIDSTLSIRQDSVIPEPTITGFYPLSGVARSFVRISGTNFRTVSSVLYDKISVESTTIASDILMIVQVPRIPKTGFLRAINQGGIAVSSTPFLIIPTAIGGF